MDKAFTQTYILLQERLGKNEAYVALLEEQKIKNDRFFTAMAQLSPGQQAAIYDYLGVLLELHYTILEAACQR